MSKKSPWNKIIETFFQFLLHDSYVADFIAGRNIDLTWEIRVFPIL